MRNLFKNLERNLRLIRFFGGRTTTPAIDAVNEKEVEEEEPIGAEPIVIPPTTPAEIIVFDVEDPDTRFGTKFIFSCFLSKVKLFTNRQFHVVTSTKKPVYFFGYRTIAALSSQYRLTELDK